MVVLPGEDNYQGEGAPLAAAVVAAIHSAGHRRNRIEKNAIVVRGRGRRGHDPIVARHWLPDLEDRQRLPSVEEEGAAVPAVDETPVVAVNAIGHCSRQGEGGGRGGGEAEAAVGVV